MIAVKRLSRQFSIAFMSSRYYRSHTSRRTGKLEKKRDRKHTMLCSFYTQSTTPPPAPSHPTPTTETSNSNPNHNQPCRHKPCPTVIDVAVLVRGPMKVRSCIKWKKRNKKKLKKKMKLSTIRIAVISETVMSTYHKAQKES